MPAAGLISPDISPQTVMIISPRGVIPGDPQGREGDPPVQCEDGSSSGGSGAPGMTSFLASRPERLQDLAAGASGLGHAEAALFG